MPSGVGDWNTVRHARPPRDRPCRPRAQGAPDRLSRQHGHDPVDHGPLEYDAPTTTRPSASARRRAWSPTRAASESSSAARATASRSPPTRWRASAPRSSGTTRPPAGPAAQRRQRRLRRRRAALRRRDDPLRRLFLHRLHRRGAAPGGSAMLADYERPATARRCPQLRPPGPRGHGCLRATPSTGWPRAPTPSPATRSGRAAPGPLRREPPASTARAARRRRVAGKHLFLDFGPDLMVHVHLGLYGSSSPS